MLGRIGQADALGLILGIPEEAPLNIQLVAGGVGRSPGGQLLALVHGVDLLVGVAEVLHDLAVVLAEAGSSADDLRGMLLEDVGDTNALHLAEALVFPLHQVLTGLELRILQDVLRTVSALAGNAGLVEDLFQLIAGVLNAELLLESLSLLSQRIV